MARSSAKKIVFSLCLVVVAALGRTSAEAAGVFVPPGARGRLGIATSRLVAARHSSETDAFAKVLDPGPLAQLDSDLAIAEAAAAASSAEAARSKALNAQGGLVSSKDTEAALAQARSDALKVAFLRRRLGLEWGPGVARMSERRREQLVRGLASGAIALVHVDTHNNEGQAGAKTVKVDVGDDSVRGIVIGPARAAEPRLQSSGLIVEVSGRAAMLLSVGLTQSAHIESATALSGVVIPRGALIRYRGSDWAYVRTGPSLFERRLIENPVPEADGFFVSAGFATGDEVVTGGATALFLAEQSRPMTAK